MPSARKTCMDNPNKPPKAHRDIIAKRRKKHTDKIKNALTPALTQAWALYRNSGQQMSMPTVDAHLAELASALESALDGMYDDDVSCNYCEFEQKETDRERMAYEMSRVSNCSGRRCPH